MKKSADILKQIKILIDDFYQNTLSGKSGLLIPNEITQLEDFLKLDHSQNEYFSLASLGKLLSIVFNRKTQFRAGYIFDNLDKFLEISESQKKFFSYLTHLKLDSESHFAKIYLHTQIFESLYHQFENQDTQIQISIFSALFKAEVETLTHYSYLLSFVEKEKNKLSELLQIGFLTTIFTQTEKNLSMLVEIMQICLEPKNRNLSAYGKVDSVPDILQALITVFNHLNFKKYNNKEKEEILSFYKHTLKFSIAKKDNGVYFSHDNFDHSIVGILEKFYSYIDTIANNKQLNELNIFLDQYPKLNNEVVSHYFSIKEFFISHWYKDYILRDQQFNWKKALYLLQNNNSVYSIKEMIGNEALEEKYQALIKKYQTDFIYKRLNEILSPAFFDDAKKIVSIMKPFTCFGDKKTCAVKILHQANLWNYDNYYRIVSHDYYNIQAATGLWLAHEIKKLYLGEQCKSMSKKVDEILQIASVLSDEKILLTDFNIITLMTSENLYNRRDYLEIMFAALEALLNNPTRNRLLNIAIQCCIAQNANTKDFLDILDAMCLTYSYHAPFKKYFGENYLQSTFHSTIEKKDEAPLFQVLQEHVEYLTQVKKLETRDYYCFYAAKNDFTFFFKKQHPDQTLDKSLYVNQKSGFHPALLSSKSDILEQKKYQGHEDFHFKFK